MNKSIVHIENADLDTLSPELAVETFRNLLWAEATTLGIGKNLINIPSAITVKDGGIDAEVRDVAATGGLGIIKVGITRYQIKTGAFSLSGDTEIRKILFDTNGALKPRVKSCLDNDGTLVVVLFGSDNPDQSDDTGAKQRIIDSLVKVDTKYASSKIEVWRQNNLISFLNKYPSLALRLTGRDNAPFQSHKSWSGDAEMRRDFKVNSAQSEIIQAIQEELRKEGEAAVHIRICGEAGVGKTRLVREATQSDDLSPLVLYSDASRFYDNPLMNELLREDNTFEAILVLDECDPELRADIWNKFKFRGRRIKIITIYNEFDETVGNTTYLNAPALRTDAIKAILEGYVPLPDYADQWVEYCGGYPRVAHVIGENLQRNPDDLLKSPDTVNVWERYFLGGDDGPELKRQRRLVLRHLALFKRVGYSGPVSSEAAVVAKLIERVDSTITFAKFQEIVEWCRRRKILQGEHTLYISPKLFHIWLWTDWWETHGPGFDLQTFTQTLPESLVEGFHEIFRYAAESKTAKNVVRKLLGPDGPFTEDYIKTKIGAHFFLALTDADPESALKCLRRTVGKWSRDELLEFTERRDIVWALERIVEWRDLFLDGARLLLALAEAENESWGNNASGVFPDIFSPAQSEVAPTELPPVERLVVVKEALSSESGTRRVLGIKAIDHALETQHFVRSIGTHRRGLGKSPQRWMPKTWGEVFDTYRATWLLLLEMIDRFSDDEKKQAVDVLLHRSRGLLQIHNIAPMVVNTLHDLANKTFVDKAELLKSVEAILHYSAKEIPQEAAEKLTLLRDRLTGSDFPSLLKRYVGMNLLTDEFDEDGNHVDRAEAHIQELARQAIADPHILQPQLGWLTTKQAEKGYQFGFELAKQDEQFTLLPHLINAQINAGNQGSAFFLGGYFRILLERNRELWENTLETLSMNATVRGIVPELTWRSGELTGLGANRILRLAQEGVLKPAGFSIFGLGGVIRTLDEDSFQEWAEFLLNTSDKIAANVLIDLFDSYYIFKSQKQLPAELTQRVLTNPALLDPANIPHNNMVGFHWMQIGLKFIEQFPERGISLAEFVLGHLGDDETIFDGFDSEPEKVINAVARRNPAEAWEIATRFLGPPIDARAWKVKNWLRGNLIFIPPEIIWAWVENDIEKRARYLASFLPKALPNKEGGILTRELLIRYGNREDVRSILSANHLSGGWAGSGAVHYRQSKENVVKLRGTEEHENVRRWLNEYIDELDALIENFKIGEERDDFHNPPV